MHPCLGVLVAQSRMNVSTDRLNKISTQNFVVQNNGIRSTIKDECATEEKTKDYCESLWRE